MNLPEGLNTQLYTDKRTGELFVQVSASTEYINSIVIDMLDEHITRVKVALPLCKHTKRNHRLTKLLSALERARVTFDDDLPTRFEGSD